MSEPATDRVFLVCDGCGDKVMLFEYHPTYAILADTDAIEAFVFEHIDHRARPGSKWLNGMAGFSLKTEIQVDDYE